MSGAIESECMLSIMGAQTLLRDKGIDQDVFVLTGCTDMPVARASLVEMFMQAEGTDLFFIDADVGFNPNAVLKVLDRPEGVVCGVYPLKRDVGDYPVRMKLEDGYFTGYDGLLEAELMPTGFMRIKRRVIELMQKEYPDLKFNASHAKTGITEAYDLFGRGTSKDKIWTTEDYAFCHRWTSIGGHLFVYPDIDFIHVGRKKYTGNFYKSISKENNNENILSTENGDASCLKTA